MSISELHIWMELANTVGFLLTIIHQKGSPIQSRHIFPYKRIKHRRVHALPQSLSVWSITTRITAALMKLSLVFCLAENAVLFLAKRSFKRQLIKGGVTIPLPLKELEALPHWATFPFTFSGVCCRVLECGLHMMNHCHLFQELSPMTAKNNTGHWPVATGKLLYTPFFFFGQPEYYNSGKKCELKNFL